MHRATVEEELAAVTEVRESLTRFVTAELIGAGDDVELSADENLLLSGKVDSFGMMRLVAFIDEQFGFAVPPEDVTIENFMSINTIANYVEPKCGS